MSSLVYVKKVNGIDGPVEGLGLEVRLKKTFPIFSQAQSLAFMHV